MENSITDDGDNDSDDLQALFDSIAGGAPPATAPPAVTPAAQAPAQPVSAGDSDELQALFDSAMLASPRAAGVAPPPAVVPAAADPQESVFNRLGMLTRQLHDSLRGLGADKILEDSARQIPDVRQRLAYIAQMTGLAASRVLNATDIAKPVQDELIARSQVLSGRWEAMFANKLSVEEFKALAVESRDFFAQAPERLKLTNDQLREIMMAQDFHDLTGQVIKKVAEIVQTLETQLLSLLLEAMPEQRKAEAPEGLLNGPVISSQGRADVVSDQSQVDDLLESLGF